MNKESREHLSCLMDGEINRETGRFLIRRLGADGELRETWARYHLIRDCLRHQEGGLADQGLSGMVREALAEEAPQKAAHRVPPRWMRPVTGVAIAASVALMAIFAVSPGQQAVTTPPDAVADSLQATPFTSPNILSRGPVSQQVNLSGGSNPGKADRKMNSYLLRHYQVAGSAGGKGFVSFVPIVVTQAPAEQMAEELPTETDKSPEQEQINRR
jgi:sigma-E factor negative regulatory protein RseA